MRNDPRHAISSAALAALFAFAASAGAGAAGAAESGERAGVEAVYFNGVIHTMDERFPVPLCIEGLVQRYGRLEVLRGLDLAVPAGAVCGLVGLNGSGKTTTIECALGLLRFAAGRISILGGQSRAPSEAA